MVRKSATILFLLALGLFASSSTLAQSATPMATPHPAEAVDLAALTLRPDDLEAVGLTNFGLANISSLRDAETEAIVDSAGDPLAAADLLNLYRLAGFQRRYVASLLNPKVPLERLPSGLVAGEDRVVAAISEYQTESGAELAFSVLEGSQDDEGLDVLGTRSFGNESDLTRSSAPDPESGDLAQRLELSFRVDNLIANIAIINYTDEEPSIETIEQLGEALRSRIARRHEEPGPGLSERVLRLEPLVTWIERGRVRDFYVRLNGAQLPTFGQIAAALREGKPFASMASPVPLPGSYLPQSTYMFWTPIGDGDPAKLPLYVAWIDHYQSRGQAEAALRAIPSDLGPGYSDVREFQMSDHLGDESRAFAYSYTGDPAGPVRGHVVMARVGDSIVRVQVDAQDGVRRAGVIDLARLQVECMRSTDNCPPVLAADVLSELLPDTVPAGS